MSQGTATLTKLTGYAEPGVRRRAVPAQFQPDSHPQSAVRGRRRGLSFDQRLLIKGSLVVLVIALAITSLLVGGYEISFESLLTDAEARRQFLISRVPRTLALILSAVAMTVCGVIMQMITQNKFVEPTTAGTSQWAGLGVLITLMAFPAAGPMVRMVIATVCAFIGTMVFLGLIRRMAVRSSIVVPLIGIMLGAVVGAITTYFAANSNLLQSMSAWRSGGFSGIVRGFYEPLWAVLIIAVLAFILANRFTAVGLGKDLATNLGIRYDLLVLIGTSMVALAVGVTTVVVGFIPFLGLVVPNIISIILGDDMKKNLPWVAALGVVLLLACDLVGRTIVAPMEIPASVILGVVGAGLFIGLVLRQRRHGGA